jgi:hypothetical protein
VDEHVWEVRLLTVVDAYRHRGVAPLLMYAALRWVDAAGGRRIVALGRHEVLPLYLKAGLEPTGHVVRPAPCATTCCTAASTGCAPPPAARRDVTHALARGVEWRLPTAMHAPPSCYHGGAFFDAVGDDFDDSAGAMTSSTRMCWTPGSRRRRGRWQLGEHLPWLVQTSPPTDAAGLVRAIAVARGVAPEQVVVGAGSSDLIFRALPRWLTPRPAS